MSAPPLNTSRRRRLHPFVIAGASGVLLKLMVGTAPDPRDRQTLIDSASVLLASRGYHMETAVQTTELTITASRDQCRMLLVEVRPQGWNTARIQTLYTDYDRIFYLYRGELLSEAPTYRATWSYQIARVLGQLHIRTDWEPIWAVLGRSACAPEALFSSS